MLIMLLIKVGGSATVSADVKAIPRVQFGTNLFLDD